MNSGKYLIKPVGPITTNTLNSNTSQDKRMIDFAQKKRKLQFFKQEFVNVVKEFITLLSSKEESKKSVKCKKKAVEAPQIKHLLASSRAKDQEEILLKLSSFNEEPSKS